MKKVFILSFLAGFATILTMQTAHADFSERIQIDEVNSRKSVVITHPHTDETYLLYLGSGCDDLEEGQEVTLVVKGNLNTNGDSIKVDFLHKCDIQQAEKFTQKLYVKYVLNSNTRAWVIEESGKEHFMYYSDSCRAMPGYWKDHVYVLQGSSNELRKGDKIFLPNNAGQCWITYLQNTPSYRSRDPETSSGGDIQKPSTVTKVQASPGNGRAHLSWLVGKDNVGIDHYIVSYNDGYLNTKDIPTQNMPNQTETQNTYLTIDGLENNKTYYFWVSAVDTSGNISDLWSTMAKATPKATVLSDDMVPSGESDMNLRIESESSRSFLIRWDKIPNVNRYTVILETDGSREFAMTGSAKRHIRILKRNHRQGKELNLIVRAYSLKGLIKEKEIGFGF